MGLLQNIDSWSEKHHPKWLDIIRILLGLLLIQKGVVFIKDMGLVTSVLQNTMLEYISAALAHYVIGAHIMGGILIAIGLLTRAAVLFQLPVLIGAVIFVNLPKGFSSFSSELWLSVIVLCLLVFFLIEGSGPISVDNYIKKHPDE